MTEAQQLRDDLNYIAATVRRAEGDGGVAAIYFLWAVLLPVGWALPDFAPHWAGPYWFVVGPLGGVASFLLGIRAERKRGEHDRKLGMAYAWHWIFAGMGFVGVIFPVAAGTMTIAQAAPYMLLVAALAYGMAGTLDPPLRWAGLVMFVGYAALTLAKLPYAWTATGLLVGGALFYSGLRARR